MSAIDPTLAVDLRCVDCNIVLWVESAFALFAVIALFIAYFKNNKTRIEKASIATEESFGCLYLSLLFGFVIIISVFAVYHRGNPLVAILFLMLGLVILFGIFRDLDTIFVCILIGFLLTVLMMMFIRRGSILLLTYAMLFVIYFYFVFGRSFKKFSLSNIQRLKRLELDASRV